jgi:catechol 2,3-dioxygenase-like lactoylglutathione lyase family enzyme
MERTMSSTTAAPLLSQIGQIAITVKDLEKAVSFYRDTLGMRFLFQVPNMAFFDCGGIRLLLGLPEQADADHGNSIIYYRVPDIQAAFRSLTERGVRFDAPPHMVAQLQDHDLWLAFFLDAESNVLALMGEVPRR